MYLIDPYKNTPAVPTLTMEAFVAPANFDPDAQELNIVKAFAAFTDVNKKYIFSVGTSTTTVLPAVTGRSYAYAENGGSYTTIASGTVTWSVGSTKRNVVVIDTASSIIANIPVGGVWCYLWDFEIYNLNSTNNPYLKYIHVFNINKLISLAKEAAFYGCINLTGKVDLRQTCVSDSSFYGTTSAIGNWTFSNCNNIDSINLNGRTYIGYQCFINCYGLKTLMIPETITYLDTKSFNGLVNCDIVLNSIGTAVILNDVFLGCKSFILNIINGVTYINRTYTSLASVLKSVIIPNSVTDTNESIFMGCTLLSSATLSTNILDVNNFLFKNCTSLKNVILSNNLKSINYSTFYGCGSLEEINLPASLTLIQSTAFSGCSALKNIYSFRAVPLSIPNIFTDVNKTTCILHVPVGSLAAYQAAPYWNEFTNIIADL